MLRGRLLVAWAAAVLGAFAAVSVLAALLPSGRQGPAGTAQQAALRGDGAATAPAAGPGPRAEWVMEENRRPGTSDWRIQGLGGAEGDVEGYADTVSAERGQSVRLFVSTVAPTFRVEAYRMGYYGGLGARLVWRSGPVPGVRQPGPVRDRRTNMVEAPWSPSLTVAIDPSWPPGDYLFKLATDAGAQRYVPLTVRDDASRAAYVIQNAVTTWQAYNRWGGYSLYFGQGNTGDNSTRSRVVSFDRPYAFGAGAGDFLGNELPLVSLVESLGLDVTYWTDVDLHRRPELLLNHRALVMLGHDEYWSRPMRRGAERARDAGVNLAFLGANSVFRQIRFEPSPLGPDRREVGYKRADEDPMRLKDPSQVTVDWRAPPVNEPESSLVGNYYECNPVKADMVVADASAWVFAGTGLADGDRLPDVVGPEYDRYDPRAPAPPGPVQLLARSPVQCQGRSSYSDMTYYTAPSGAGVFATGTNWWISRLGTPCPVADCRPDPRVSRITQNVLEVFGTGPAGWLHPSVANLHRLPALTTTTIGRAGRPSTTSPRLRPPLTVGPSSTLDLEEQPLPTSPAVTVPIDRPRTRPGPTSTASPGSSGQGSGS